MKKKERKKEKEKNRGEDRPFADKITEDGT